MNKTDALAALIARWMPDAFADRWVQAVDRPNIKWPDDFGASERAKFRKVARAVVRHLQGETA